MPCGTWVSERFQEGPVKPSFMKILHTVEFYAPSMGGSQEVVRQISERLTQRGHAVTVATSRDRRRNFGELNGVRIEGFDVSGNEVKGIQGEVERYQRFLLDGDFDVMLNYAAQQWPTDLAFTVLERLPYRKALVPCGFSGLNYANYAGYFERMPERLRLYDRLIFHARDYRDVRFARQHGIDRTCWIPNGAAESEFREVGVDFRAKYHIPVDAPLILTVGSHTGSKGHRLAIETIGQMEHRPVYLVIIGNVLTKRNCLADCQRRAWVARLVSLGRKQVLLLDLPRTDVIGAYQAADVFFFGSNVEYSPLVLFEAMAAGLPFVSLNCGNAGEIAAWSEAGLILPTYDARFGRVEGNPREAAAVLDGLLDAPDQRDGMGKAGRKIWLEQFTWEKITLQYEQLYQELCSSDS
jgi:glycosyltransferase involved in cell wall biosynthesis